MKTRLSMIATTLAALFASSAFAATHTAVVSSSMTIDAEAPLRATLLPTVSIDATSATSASNPPRMHVAETAPVEVTLLPTVHVTARTRHEVATTLLPVVRVTAAAPAAAAETIAEAADAALPAIEEGAAQRASLPGRAMPR